MHPDTWQELDILMRQASNNIHTENRADFETIGPRLLELLEDFAPAVFETKNTQINELTAQVSTLTEQLSALQESKKEQVQ